MERKKKIDGESEIGAKPLKPTSKIGTRNFLKQQTLSNDTLCPQILYYTHREREHTSTTKAIAHALDHLTCVNHLLKAKS